MKSNILGSKLRSSHRDKDVVISIGDIRKTIIRDGRNTDTTALIIDKLEELENRISKIESTHINKDEIKDMINDMTAYD